MKQVLICAFRYLESCQEGAQLLRQNGIGIKANPGTVPYTREELCRLVGDVDAVITGNEVWDEEEFYDAHAL